MAVLNILEVLKNLRDQIGYSPRICQASSGEMFGLVSELPLREESPQHPRSPYAVSKSFAHHTAVNYRESYGMFVASAILFNHESPLRPANFVTRKITRGVAAVALGKMDHLKLGQLAVRRDWGSARDYVTALHAILTHDVPETFVVATGVSSSLDDFLSLAFAQVGITNYQDYIVTDPQLLRPADVPETMGDPSKICQELSWQSGVTLSELVRRMVEVDMQRIESGMEQHLSYL